MPDCNIFGYLQGTPMVANKIISIQTFGAPPEF